MNVKKIKRKCGVRGCKNTASFVISKTREMGGSIIMCRECMADALKSTEGYVEPEKVKKAPKPLFPHPKSEVTLSSVADVEPKPQEVIDADAEDVDISVAEDTVTHNEEPITTTTKPDVKLPSEATRITSTKKKPNKKK